MRRGFKNRSRGGVYSILWRVTVYRNTGIQTLKNKTTQAPPATQGVLRSQTCACKPAIVRVYSRPPPMQNAAVHICKHRQVFSCWLEVHLEGDSFHE
jgi:hypothetical protein